MNHGSPAKDNIRKPDINFLGLYKLAQAFYLLLQAFTSLCKFEKDKKSPKSLCQVSWWRPGNSRSNVSYKCLQWQKQKGVPLCTDRVATVGDILDARRSFEMQEYLCHELEILGTWWPGHPDRARRQVSPFKYGPVWWQRLFENLMILW